MKTTLTVTRRGVVTLPAKLRRALGLKPEELYSEARVREFDQAEAELGAALKKKKRAAR